MDNLFTEQFTAAGGGERPSARPPPGLTRGLVLKGAPRGLRKPSPRRGVPLPLGSDLRHLGPGRCAKEKSKRLRLRSKYEQTEALPPGRDGQSDPAGAPPPSQEGHAHRRAEWCKRQQLTPSSQRVLNHLPTSQRGAASPDRYAPGASAGAGRLRLACSAAPCPRERFPRLICCGSRTPLPAGGRRHAARGGHRTAQVAEPTSLTWPPAPSCD